MNKKTVLMIILSLLCGLSAAYFASRLLTGSPEHASSGKAQEMAMSQVVVADEDIVFATRIETEMLRTIQMEAGSVPEGAYRQLTEVVGQVALKPFYKGEIVLSQRLKESGNGGLLAARVSPGKRAVSVKVSEFGGVGGFIAPGDRVDVLVSYKKADRSPASERVLDNIRVLGVGQTAIAGEEAARKYRTVTLEIPAEYVQMVVLASSSSRISLALRNPGDFEEFTPESQSTLEVIRGSSRQNLALGG
ncbi:MAG: Flp pilus assembly protein CpaB [Endozoicomonas sp.]